MIVVDASVAVKWTVEEDGHDEAMEILDRSEELIAPDLLLPESANVFRRKLKQKEIPEAQAVEAMLAIRLAIRSFLPSRDLIDDAWQIAQQLDHSVYDCVYLACALPAGVLVTADEGFIRKCESGGYERFVCRPRAAVEWLAQRSVGRLGQPLLENVERLSAKVQETFDALAKSPRSEGSLSGLKVVSSGDFAPAFDSPAYRRLSKELDALEADELSVLVALGWLGRSYNSVGRWQSLLANARDMVARGRTQHAAYFIAQMGQVNRGLARLRPGTAPVETAPDHEAF